LEHLVKLGTPKTKPPNHIKRSWLGEEMREGIGQRRLSEESKRKGLPKNNLEGVPSVP